MNLFMQMTINSVFQICLFSLLPFLWWLITARKKEGFLTWIGIKRVQNMWNHKMILWILGTTFLFLFLSLFMFWSLKNVEMATSVFAGKGCSALAAIGMYAVFNTALSEEIVFRGFLLKRVSEKFGFYKANGFQSALFGLMHGVLFITTAGFLRTIWIVLFTGMIGWLMGFINEKIAKGSILPSWCIHAGSNIFAGLCSAFLLF